MSRPDSPLRLYEEVLLLALDNRTGTPVGGLYPAVLGGALLSELFLEGRLKTVPTWMLPLIEVVDKKPLENELLDECLDRVATAKRRCGALGWVQRFMRIRHLTNRITEELCRRGILKATEGKIFWVFNRTVYPEKDPRPERTVIERLRRAASSGGANVDPRTASLLALTYPSGLLRAIFTREEMKRWKPRIEQIIKGDTAGTATRDAIAAGQAAIAAAFIVPATSS